MQIFFDAARTVQRAALLGRHTILTFKKKLNQYAVSLAFVRHFYVYHEQDTRPILLVIHRCADACDTFEPPYLMQRRTFRCVERPMER
jgi:hypothetical protein